jgi:hypothetical protein
MEFSVLCASNFVVDKVAWNSYLSGLNINQAVKHFDNTNILTAEITSILLTQYRNFEMIEYFLHHPKMFNTQLIYSIPFTTKQALIQTYYKLDSRVLREFLGKKLNNKLRKDLESISQKTRISFIACKRMFDNLKRIAKHIEDVEGDLVVLIMKYFSLSKELASQYLYVIFICSHRLDPNKRKLSQVKYEDFEYSNKMLM